MNKVNVLSERKKYEVFEKKLKEAVRAVFKILKKDNLLVEIYLISDEEIRRLNRKFRKKNKPANVLSFEEPRNFPHPETGYRFIGEVYLAPDYINRKKENLIRLALHGVLHLLGFSHWKKRDRIKMEKLEHRLLKLVSSN